MGCVYTKKIARYDVRTRDKDARRDNRAEKLPLQLGKPKIIADLTSENLGLKPDIELDLGLASYARLEEK